MSEIIVKFVHYHKEQDYNINLLMPFKELINLILNKLVFIDADGSLERAPEEMYYIAIYSIKQHNNNNEF